MQCLGPDIYRVVAALAGAGRSGPHKLTIHYALPVFPQFPFPPGRGSSEYDIELASPCKTSL